MVTKRNTPTNESYGESLDLLIMAPDITLAEAKKKHGDVPIRHGISLHFSIPAETLVGQSGPPIRIPTLPIVILGSRSISLIPIVNEECTLIVYCMFWLFPRYLPMIFCCMAHANSLSEKATQQVIITPYVKKVVSYPLDGLVP